jgi:hypothetical protein
MPDLEGGRGKLKTTSQIFGIRRKNKCGFPYSSIIQVPYLKWKKKMF